MHLDDLYTPFFIAAAIMFLALTLLGAFVGAR